MLLFLANRSLNARLVTVGPVYKLLYDLINHSMSITDQKKKKKQVDSSDPEEDVGELFDKPIK